MRTCFLLLLFLFPGICSSLEFSGVCTRVVNGKTITVMTGEGLPVRVRLYGINGPDGGQAYAGAAKQALSSLVYGRTVSVRKYDIDGHDRVIGVVTLDGADMNGHMLSKGLAWVEPRFCHAEICAGYVEMESAAREGRAGFWSDGRDGHPRDWGKSRE